MEGQPLDALTEHHPGGHQQLGEVQRVDALILVLLELNAGRGQELDGVLGIHVLSGDRTHGRERVGHRKCILGKGVITMAVYNRHRTFENWYNVRK